MSSLFSTCCLSRVIIITTVKILYMDYNAQINSNFRTCIITVQTISPEKQIGNDVQEGAVRENACTLFEQQYRIWTPIRFSAPADVKREHELEGKRN